MPELELNSRRKQRRRQTLTFRVVLGKSGGEGEDSPKLGLVLICCPTSKCACQTTPTCSAHVCNRVPSRGTQHNHAVRRSRRINPLGDSFPSQVVIPGIEGDILPILHARTHQEVPSALRVCVRGGVLVWVCCMTLDDLCDSPRRLGG